MEITVLVNEINIVLNNHTRFVLVSLLHCPLLSGMTNPAGHLNL